MNSFTPDKSLFETIVSAEAKAYLLAQGWIVTGTIADKGLIFAKNEASEEIILPIRKDLGDYAARMAELIVTLSETEQKNPYAVINDIKRSGVDVVRIRLLDKTEDGSAGLNAASETLHHAKDMLLAAACAALEPRKFFGSKKNEEAKNFVNQIRVGQTEYGSFVLTLLSPVTPKISPQPFLFSDDDFEDEPFERIVTKRLLSSLHSVRSAALDTLSSDTMTAFENTVPNGVSANLCDAVSNIVKEAGKVEISLSWAKTRPMINSQTKEKVVFDRDLADVIAEAGKNFRLSEPRYAQQIKGWVYQLQKKREDENRNVSIHTMIDGKLKILKAKLSEEDYNKSLQAHSEEKFVSLEGDLHLQGKTAELHNPRNLYILNENEQ